MKLLFQSGEKSEIDDARLLLESKGIPVFVGNETSAQNLGIVLATRRYAFWVVFDEQFEDALALLKDREHEVSNPVDIDAYYREMDHVREKSTENLFNKMMLFLVVLALAIIGALILGGA